MIETEEVQGLRYDLVRESLEHLRRPFTVLDLGAGSGYFAHRLATDLDCRVTAVDSHLSHVSIDDPRITVISRRLTTNEIRQLGSFDVVLALSVLHHFTDWTSTLEVLQSMTRALMIVETPTSDAEVHSPVERATVGPLWQVIEHVGAAIGALPGLGLFGLFGWPVQLVGRVVTEKGTMHQFWGDAIPTLGYEAHQFSVNLIGLGRNVRQTLGPPAIIHEDDASGHYDLWPAYVQGLDVPAWAMKSPRGPKALEILSPVNLREDAMLNDSDQVVIEVGAR